MPKMPEHLKSIPIGRKPKGKPDAWRALSKEAKRILADMRQTMGVYGGTPGKAPYWKSQEEGNPAALIDAQHYIQRSLESWRAEIPMIVREWLRS